MISHSDEQNKATRTSLVSPISVEGLSPAEKPAGPSGQGRPRLRPDAGKRHILIVEDDEAIRESLAALLLEEGYEISFAENGREALALLHAGNLPDIIVLDLRMPVMDGWEFRMIQKDDPELGLIPVVAISADRSAQAAAVSAQAYVRKPIDVKEFLGAVERILFENERRRISVRLEETERLTSLGRLASGVGHEINNPLTFIMLNLSQTLEKLQSSLRSLEAPDLPQRDVDALKDRLLDVADMLRDCQVGGERIRETIKNLQHLSHRGGQTEGPVDVRELVHQAISMAWNQMRHRARLDKHLLPTPQISGNAGALVRVFLNLLLNAAQAIPEGDAERNQIRIATTTVRGNILVEVSDTGMGMAPEVLVHMFDPFYTTKPLGQGTGLGLSICRQTVRDHGGRMEVESEPGKGTTLRVFLPLGNPGTQAIPTSEPSTDIQTAPARARILIIDDEPLIGRTIGTALCNEHEVFIAQRASEAIARLAHGEVFDLLLCDVVMPDLSGPDFYATVAERWPDMVSALVFMTGGAFTPKTAEFVERVPVSILLKPFKIEQVKRLVRERMREKSLRTWDQRGD